MKAAVPLLVTVLVVGLLNLLHGFGLFGGSSNSDSYQYIVYAAEDIPPFVTFLATEEFKDKADDEGNITFPQGELFDIRKSLPRMINFMSNEGWELVNIKEATGVHVFRRPMGGDLVDAPRPWEDGSAVPAAAGSDAGDAGAADAPADSGAAVPAPLPTAGGADASSTPAPAPAGN